MTELVKNTYTLIACIVTVSTLASAGGVSLYIIQRGFADQARNEERISLLESMALSKSERDRWHDQQIAANLDEIRANREELKKLRDDIATLRARAR